MQSQFFECKPCGKKFTGKECMQQHMESIKHLRKIKIFSMQGTLVEKALPEPADIMDISSSDTLDGNKSVEALAEKESDDSRSKFILPDSGLSISLECQICLKSYSSIAMYMLHIKSNEHLEVVQAKLENAGVPPPQFPVASAGHLSYSSGVSNQFYCNVCDVSCTGEAPFNQHLASAKHKKKKSQNAGVTLADVTPVPRSLGEATSSNSTDGKINQIMICETCNVPCSGSIPYEMHLRSDKHKKKASQKTSCPTGENSNNLDIMVCNICDVSCCGIIPYEMHLKGEKHRKKMNQKNIIMPTEVNNSVGKYKAKAMISSSSDLIHLIESSGEDSMAEELADCNDSVDGSGSCSSSDLIRRIRVVPPSIRDIICKEGAAAEFREKHEIAMFNADEPIDFVKMFRDTKQNDEMMV